MADPAVSFPPFDLDDDDSGLARLLSPADAESLHTPAGSPPVTAPSSNTAQSTPLTGTLAAAPAQARPRVTGQAMLPGVAARPESLPSAQAGGGRTTTLLMPQPGSMADRPTKYARQVVSLPTGSDGLTAPTALPAARGYGALMANKPGKINQQQQSGAGGLMANKPTSTAAPSPLNVGGPSALKQRWTGVLNSQQAHPAMPSSVSSGSSSSSIPNLGTATQPNVVPDKLNMQTQRDQSRLAYLTNSGSGVSQIKNPVVRDIARVGDVLGSALAPGWAAAVPGTTLHHQGLVDQQQGIVANDQGQQQRQAALSDTQSQSAERDAAQAKNDALASSDRPYVISIADAQSIGHPELAGSQMTPRQLTALQVQQGKNTATLATHTGGQPHKVTADDARLVGAPALEGETISNDAWQRMISGVERNAQSGSNNAANNATRVKTTGMRDATSTANSERTHQGKGGAPKPIPAGVRDRIESQKDTAINKARSDFDSGVSTMDDYLNAWQAAQNDYENRIGTQTGQSVPHLDIRSNVDQKGNWIGNRQASQPQPNTRAQPSPADHAFSQSAWQRANPKGNIATATARAKQLGYQVVQ